MLADERWHSPHLLEKLSDFVYLNQRGKAESVIKRALGFSVFSYNNKIEENNFY